MNSELLDLDGAVGRGNTDNGGQSTLGDDGNARALGVLLGQKGELLGDLDNVLSAPLVAGGVGTSLSLVTEGVVSVGENAVQLLLEELGNEGGGEGEHEDLEVGMI